MMLMRQGKTAIVKILDFGLAKASREGPAESELTQQGQTLGTPDYVAPEQVLDAVKADIRADIYSLGCTLYHLLSGGPPFQGPSSLSIMQKHLSHRAERLDALRQDVPPELADVVAKMMAKKPAERFQTPREVARRSSRSSGRPGPQINRLPPVRSRADRRARAQWKGSLR